MKADQKSAEMKAMATDDAKNAAKTVKEMTEEEKAAAEKKAAEEAAAATK
ncbi:MAG: hypothetical protein PHI06_00380 [Desulfobulbaceae bacterium]|nr:hypothetical protein [Desulfobulbaceae bacterium]